MKKKIFAIVLTVLACLTILEFGLRALGRKPTNMADGIFDQWGDSFRLKKNISKLIALPAFSYTVHTNEFGFRDGQTGSQPVNNEPLCVFLGASDVFGNGVNYEDSFVGLFAKEALEKKGLRTFNLAVGGHYILDQEALLKDLMQSTARIPSIIYLTLNALHIPKFDLRNQHIIVKSGYAIDESGWQLTYLRLMAGNVSSAFCFFRDATRKIQELYFDYEFSDKSPDFFQPYAKMNSIRQPERIRLFYDQLRRFKAFCQKQNIDLVFIYLPLSDSFRLKDMVLQLGFNPDEYDIVFYEDLLRTHCLENNIKFINLRPVLEQHYEDGKELRFKLDPHFNSFSNRVIAEQLIDEILH